MNKKLFTLLIKENLFDNKRKFLIRISFFLIIFLIIISFILLLPIYQHNYIAYYQNSEFDIILEACSEEQIVELKEAGVISDYKNYRIFTNVSLLTEKFLTKTSLMAFDSYENLNLTFFPSKNIISEKKSNAARQIYIDYTISKDLQIAIGDSVSLQVGEEKVDFLVTRIYENVSFSFRSTCMVLWEGRLKEIANANSEVKIHGSMAKLVNGANVQSIKNDYIAEGILKVRPNEVSDAEWSAYLNTFYAEDYSSFVIEKKQAIDEVKNDLRYTPPIILGVSLMGAILIVLFSFREHKKILDLHKKQFAILNALGFSKLKYLLLFIFSSAVIQIPILLVSTILCKLLIYNLIVKTSYLPWYFLFEYFWLFAIVVLVSIMCCNFLVYLKIKKINTSYILVEE